eukprot:m.1134626 g.1134626  ORF g.1134626 m.1134626 type:complete len:106 (-) comp24427_c1_seq75:1331-1648(-)
MSGRTPCFHRGSTRSKRSQLAPRQVDSLECSGTISMSMATVLRWAVDSTRRQYEEDARMLCHGCAHTIKREHEVVKPPIPQRLVVDVVDAKVHLVADERRSVLFA